MRNFVPVPSWWAKYEAPCRFMPETLWFLPYREFSLAGQYFKDEDSSWNVIVLE